MLCQKRVEYLKRGQPIERFIFRRGVLSDFMRLRAHQAVQKTGSHFLRFHGSFSFLSRRGQQIRDIDPALANRLATYFDVVSRRNRAAKDNLGLVTVHAQAQLRICVALTSGLPPYLFRDQNPLSPAKP